MQILEQNASHAIECAKYLAEIARKFARISTEFGDVTDVNNNLLAIILVLNGKNPELATSNDCPLEIDIHGMIKGRCGDRRPASF